MGLFSRQEILERLRNKVAQSMPIVGGGAGTGISAKMSEAGGVDLLVIYNSGRFRMGGRGSLSGSPGQRSRCGEPGRSRRRGRARPDAP